MFFVLENRGAEISYRTPWILHDSALEPFCFCWMKMRGSLYSETGWNIYQKNWVKLLVDLFGCFPGLFLDLNYLVVVSTHLQNMRKSNWVHLPQIGMNIRTYKNYLQPPPRLFLLCAFFFGFFSGEKLWEELTQPSSKTCLLLLLRDSHEKYRKHVDVSENSGTPNSSILIGFSIINHPFGGTPIFGNTHVCLSQAGVVFFVVLVCMQDPSWNHGIMTWKIYLQTGRRYDAITSQQIDGPDAHFWACLLIISCFWYYFLVMASIHKERWKSRQHEFVGHLRWRSNSGLCMALPKEFKVFFNKCGATCHSHKSLWKITIYKLNKSDKRHPMTLLRGSFCTYKTRSMRRCQSAFHKWRFGIYN